MLTQTATFILNLNDCQLQVSSLYLGIVVYSKALRNSSRYALSLAEHCGTSSAVCLDFGGEFSCRSARLHQSSLNPLWSLSNDDANDLPCELFPLRRYAFLGKLATSMLETLSFAVAVVPLW